MSASGEIEAQKVFICYRREETAAHAGRLYDAMVARFGESNVFMDVDIEPGVDFVERITDVVSGCLVLIVVMGPRWATVEDDEGQRRIADPDDFVRLEVETGLRRADVTPIPVLVSGARMPKREALPEPLRPLTRRNALDLSDGRWSYDVGRLNTTLDGLLGENGTSAEPQPTAAAGPPTPAPDPPTPAPRPVPATTRSHSSLDWRLILEGALVAALAAVLGRLLMEIPVFDKGDDQGKAIAVILQRGVTWALVGAAVATWLGARTRRTDTVALGLTGLLLGALAGAAGGAIWAARVYVPEPNLGVESTAANNIQLLALAVTGGLAGGLLGGLWRPRRIAVGLAAGAVAAIVLQLLLNLLDWNVADQPGNAFNFGLVAAAVVATALFALSGRRAAPAHGSGSAHRTPSEPVRQR